MLSMTTEERISRLEGAYEHLATKADVAELKADVAELKADIAHIEARMLRWLLPTIIASIGATAAIVRLVAGG